MLRYIHLVPLFHMTRRRLYFSVAFFMSLVIVLPAYGQYGYHFGRNKVQYEDFDWHVLKTKHFDVYYYPQMQELAEYGGAFAEEVYQELENKFVLSLNRRVPIIFYSSNIHFKQTNTTPGFIPDGVGGFFEFLKGRVVIPANGDIHRFRRVVRHELVHVFTYSKVLRILRDHRIPPDSFLPLWFTEGLAEYWSGEPDYQHEMVMRDAVISNYLVPLEDMNRIAGTYLMYKEGEAIFRFISETYGEEKILSLIENFWKDRDFRIILEITLREDFYEIAAKWQQWLKQQYYPILESSELTSHATTAIAHDGFNSKPAFYQFKDGRRKVFFVANRTGYTNVYETTVDSLYRPVEKPRVLIRGERTDRFEAFHLFESRISVSQDGKLAFVTKSGERDVIHVYDLESDVLVATYGFDGLIAVYSPDWSPDGTKLVFSSINEGGFSDLYLYNTTEGGLRKLTSDSYDDRDPAWSPDGEQIAFSSDRTSEGKEDAYNLFTYTLEDGSIQYVTFGRHHDFSPRWSPDGDYLVYTSARRDSTNRFGAQNIWVADMQGAASGTPEVASTRVEVTPAIDGEAKREVRQLTDYTAAAFDPVWTRDNQLLFTSFEHFRFTIRGLSGVDSLAAFPERQEEMKLDHTGGHWGF